MKILLTGGLGYIGSHVAICLSKEGHQVILFDNLVNSNIHVLDRLNLILGKTLPFIRGDIRDQSLVQAILKQYQVDAVMHFAGLKAVGESLHEPLKYYDNNVSGTISLLRAMQICDIKTLIFSSSATVYGTPQYLPIDELHPTNPESPYGQTKLQIEEILKSLSFSDKQWRIIALRYFNPVGAHESGLIGEEPNGVPNNLMPYISLVASGKLNKVRIFGNNYETTDGTGVRDYIHIMDLAEGHVYALDYLKNKTGFFVINLGTGCGYSVSELIKAYESVSKKIIPHEVVGRRAGDVAVCYSNAEKAFIDMRWRAKRTLLDMCGDSWRWVDAKTRQ